MGKHYARLVDPVEEVIEEPEDPSPATPYESYIDSHDTAAWIQHYQNIQNGYSDRIHTKRDTPDVVVLDETNSSYLFEAGRYDTECLVEIDPDKLSDLSPINIAAGATIFGVTGDDNVVNTGGATAREQDIHTGKTAYVNGQLIVGKNTYDADTRDATADASKILTGYTAYINGQKVEGACTYDADTSDADATMFNIAYGKTAYVNGEKIVGVSRYDADTSGATVVASDIVAGKRAYAHGEEVMGTMPDHSNASYIITRYNQVNSINAGYYNGYGVVKLDETERDKFIPSNIKSGVTLLGVTGASNIVDTSDSNAMASDILIDKVAYANGERVVGTMPDRGGIEGYISSIGDLFTIQQGYHDGTGSVSISANAQSSLVADNIKAGESILGVNGTFTADANASANDILVGHTAYVNGVMVNGSFELQDKSVTPSANAQVVYPDNGCGLSSVTVNATPLETTILVPSSSTRTVYPNSPNIGFSQVQINAVPLSYRSVNPETTTKVYTPAAPSLGYAQFTVNAIPSQYVNTSDATATASDILSGVTAYVNGQKVVGTFEGLDTGDATATIDEICINKTAYIASGKVTGTGDMVHTINGVPNEKDTSIIYVNSAGEYYKWNDSNAVYSKWVDTADATANASTILSGATAYVNGVKINGSYVPLDTSDANATSSDIMSGKTAYVNGAKVNGNYVPLDTSDANATANDLLSGKTAYVNGTKINGSYVPLNTSDANATASDIMSGKTAYVNGTKVNGSYVPLDTSDATASESTILEGNTAYVNGVKVTGSYVPEAGLDTSDATAVAADILLNKTAYVNGVKITGNATANASDIKQGVTILGTTGTLDYIAEHNNVPASKDTSIIKVGEYYYAWEV